MKLTIESTSQVVQLETCDRRLSIPARVWEGQTDTGIPVHCYVTRLNPLLDKDDPANAPVFEEFGRQLMEQKAPSLEFGPIPLRLIL